MPELPEVEWVRRGLEEAAFVGPVTRLWRSAFPLRTGQWWRREGVEALAGSMPGPVERRGKHLIWTFDRDDRRLGLLVHLGMSGRLSVDTVASPHLPHTHLVIGFPDGRELRFVDPRRFGGVRVAERDVLHRQPPLDALGPEPLGRAFDGAHLRDAAGHSARCVRDVLLDQRVVAGLGNIYVLEALFHARLHPLLRASRLRSAAWDRLAGAIRRVLKQGIRNGGTTFRDFRHATGTAGRNQSRLYVYGRAGEPCRDCGAALVGFERGGRRGVFCPQDQPRPKTRWVE